MLLIVRNCDAAQCETEWLYGYIQRKTQQSIKKNCLRHIYAVMTEVLTCTMPYFFSIVRCLLFRHDYKSVNHKYGPESEAVIFKYWQNGQFNFDLLPH